MVYSNTWYKEGHPDYSNTQYKEGHPVYRNTQYKDKHVRDRFLLPRYMSSHMLSLEDLSLFLVGDAVNVSTRSLS